MRSFFVSRRIRGGNAKDTRRINPENAQYRAKAFAYPPRYLRVSFATHLLLTIAFTTAAQSTATATAEIDIRLVPSSNAENLVGLIHEHIAKQGYYIIDREPTEEERMTHPKIVSLHPSYLYNAFQTPFNSEVGQWLTKAMVKTFQKEPIRIRTAGGSIPISPFVVTLGIPAVCVPTVNPDNNQHAENENIRVGNYIDAVKIFTAILGEKL